MIRMTKSSRKKVNYSALLDTQYINGCGAYFTKGFKVSVAEDHAVCDQFQIPV